MEEIFRWSELLKHLEEAHCEVRTFPKDRVRFTYSFEGAEVPVGAHVIRSLSGTPWLAINMKVGPVAQLRLRSALVANADLPVGGICILPDDMVIRQTLPLQGIRVVDLEHAIKGLATLRAQLQEVAQLPDVDIETPFAFIFR